VHVSYSRRTFGPSALEELGIGLAHITAGCSEIEVESHSAPQPLGERGVERRRTVAPVTSLSGFCCLILSESNGIWVVNIGILND
jgi:hypothetical protein